MMRHNDASIIIPSYFLRNFPVFDKIDSSLKTVWNVLQGKKVDYIFDEQLNLHIIVV